MDGAKGQRVVDGHAEGEHEPAVRAARSWWDGEADAYQAEHGAFLDGDRPGADRSDAATGALIWGPEGLREEDARLLGDGAGLAGRTLLEVGCGAGQGARWAAAQGARVVALDLSVGQLRHLGVRLRASSPALRAAVCALQGDAAHLPLAGGCIDAAFSAYGALPFTPHADRVLAEVRRVLRPGGRWVFAVTHPIRWAFPDDPGPAGLSATLSYFDRRPYLEHGLDGALTYAEYHRTVGDWVRLLRAAGFVLDDLVEPQWPEGHERTWGGWSPLRGERLPGTAIFCCRAA